MWYNVYQTNCVVNQEGLIIAAQAQILINLPNAPKPPIPQGVAANGSPFMQNKPNFTRTKMNVTVYIEKNYGHKPRLRNPPKQTQFQTHHPRTAHATTNMQNKPNLLLAQMNVSTVLTTDYQNTRPCQSLQNKPNFNTITSPDKCSTWEQIWKNKPLPAKKSYLQTQNAAGKTHIRRKFIDKAAPGDNMTRFEWATLA